MAHGLKDALNQLLVSRKTVLVVFAASDTATGWRGRLTGMSPC